MPYAGGNRAAHRADKEILAAGEVGFSDGESKAE
jgi:hypothetical protein